MLILIAAESVAQSPIDFDRQVAPILVSHCLECHSGDSPKGGLSLESSDMLKRGGDSGPVLSDTDATSGLLWQRIEADEMPPKHPLSAVDKAVIREWIHQGAAWGGGQLDLLAATTDHRAGRDWWSLQPLRRVTVPALVSASGRSHANPIDAFIQVRLQEAGLPSAGPATPRQQVRRVFFDLTGLPPTPQQVASFEADPADQAWQKIVDELLESSHYGERWGRHWLDVVRFGESDGFERNHPRDNAWPYRDWVIRALNADIPYTDFVRMQLMGDLLSPGPEGAAATGFWVAGVHNTVVGGSQRMKQLAREDEIEEVLATVGQTFLGLTINCGRCHDHKFDPVTQREYYQLASAISGLGFGERTVRNPVDEQRLKDTEAELMSVTEQLAVINQTARKEILAARAAGTLPTPEPPPATALWEFDHDLKDSIGQLHGTAHGNAAIQDGALHLDGSSFVETAPLKTEISEKTLTAWVQLANLNQRGGAVMSLETRNGATFDAIVFGEQQPGHWMPGSNNFARTESFRGTPEQDAVQRIVHIAIVYSADGKITAYRDGVAYGQSVRKSDLQSYQATETEILFGLRHKPPGGNRFLEANIHRAAFYSRALSADEVAASAGDPSAYVPDEQVVEWLNPEQRRQRAELSRQVAELTAACDEIREAAQQKIYCLTPGKAQDIHVLLRGDPDLVGEAVSPGGTTAIAGLDADFSLSENSTEADRRRCLADWVTHRDNALFARVIVNRLWHLHFGVGLVETPSDFGFNGGRPSHPDLLEYLSTTLQDEQYRLKPIHRLIVTSKTYRQASTMTDSAQFHEAMQQDADNRLLWRSSLRRLEAESVRDAMLVISGSLNESEGGAGFRDVTVRLNNGTTYYEPIDELDSSFLRRTVYRFSPRGDRSALLDTFDCPDTAATAPRRSVTTTPLQALSLLNNSFVLQMSQRFADRLRREAGSNAGDQIQLAWRLAMARIPDAREQQLSEQLVRQHGLEALCRGLFNSSELIILE
ncbi:MAG: DUF1553 domain-containing protein [Planctomycetaceae bacterium]